MSRPNDPHVVGILYPYNDETGDIRSNIAFFTSPFDPAAQAADADPSRCNSTNRQYPPFSKMTLTFESLMGF